MTSKELLAAMKAGDCPSGVCIQGVWAYLLDGKPITRAVNTLKRQGLADGHYMSGGRAAINLTEAGREA